MPQLYGDTPCVPAGGHTFAVSAKVTDEKKLAGIAEFMKFAYQPEKMCIRDRNNGALSKSRYENYLLIYEELKEKDRRKY